MSDDIPFDNAIDFTPDQIDEPVPAVRWLMAVVGQSEIEIKFRLVSWTG